MQVIESLPPRPMTVGEILGYRQQTGIEFSAPLVGKDPDPRETVVGLYLGTEDAGTYAGFDTTADAWCGRSIPTSGLTEGWILATWKDVLAFICEQDPDASYAFFSRRPGPDSESVATH